MICVLRYCSYLMEVIQPLEQINTRRQTLHLPTANTISPKSRIVRGGVDFF